MEFVIINFRVTPTERQRLRVALLEEGVTLQAFFVQVVREKLSTQLPWRAGTPACPGEAVPVTAGGEPAP